VTLLGEMCPKTPEKWASIGVFKPILHSDKDHQTPFQDGGRPHRLGKIEKSSYLRNGSIDFDQLWHGEAVQPLEPSDR